MSLFEVIRDSKVGKYLVNFLENGIEVMDNIFDYKNLSRRNFVKISVASIASILAQACGRDEDEALNKAAVSGIVSDSQTSSPLAGVKVSIDVLVSTTGNDGGEIGAYGAGGNPPVPR